MQPIFEGKRHSKSTVCRANGCIKRFCRDSSSLPPTNLQTPVFSQKRLDTGVFHCFGCVAVGSYGQPWRHRNGTVVAQEITGNADTDPGAGLVPLRPVSARFSGRWRALKTRRNRAQKKDAARPLPAATPDSSQRSCPEGPQTKQKAAQKKAAKLPQNATRKRLKRRKKSDKKRLRKFRKVCTKKMHPGRPHKSPGSGMERKTGRKVRKSTHKKRPRRGAGVVVTWWRLWAGACAFLSRSCSRPRAST